LPGGPPWPLSRVPDHRCLAGVGPHGLPCQGGPTLQPRTLAGWPVPVGPHAHWLVGPCLWAHTHNDGWSVTLRRWVHKIRRRSTRAHTGWAGAATLPCLLLHLATNPLGSCRGRDKVSCGAAAAATGGWCRSLPPQPPTDPGRCLVRRLAERESPCCTNAGDHHPLNEPLT